MFVMVAIWYYMYKVYSARSLNDKLFGADEENILEIRLIRNIIYDIENDIFRIDFLLAAISSLFWFRCLLLLRLSEQFGPLIEMIFAMLLVFSQFILLYIIELVTFSCIAALTMSENPAF